jgi:AmmeMemoRadiSam system protein A
MALKTKKIENTSPIKPRPSDCAESQASDLHSDQKQIPALARNAVEAYVSERRVIEPLLSTQTSLLNQPSACFVTIKTLGRELRGCIGTVEPEKSTLAEEVIANAIKAATRDPRFQPVSAKELSSLQYSVDVLGSPESARFDDLDPSIFGVVVVDHTGLRRGLLLPNIESIETAEHQVRVAAMKAGIKPDEPLRLYRFRTHRFSERERPLI